VAELQFQNVSPRQLAAMGDGLLGVGEFAVARSVYEAALKSAPAAMRQSLLTRLGMAATGNRRTPALLKLLRDLEMQGYANPFVSDGMATWLKTLPFAEDDRFTELSLKHAGLLPIANWQWNLQTVLWAVLRNRDVAGDYVELGVFKGHTTLFCAEYVGFGSWPRTWWLYDTFEGIPDDQQAPGWEETNARAYKGSYSLEEVRERFAPFPNIKVIKGRAPEVLNGQAPDQIAFLHVDMNNAPAEIGSLEVLFDRVSAGGIIILDDYTWSATYPQFVAEKAWFAARGLHVLPLPTGQGVFIKS
jgi:hypothetical protein